MTRDEFIAAYCERSGMAWERLQKIRDVEVCYCGIPFCGGWKMVPCKLKENFMSGNIVYNNRVVKAAPDHGG